MVVHPRRSPRLRRRSGAPSRPGLVDQARTRTTGSPTRGLGRRVRRLVGHDGELVDDQASASLGLGWSATPLNPTDRRGAGPRAADEIVIDRRRPAGGNHPGDRVTVLSKGAPRDFTLAGVATYGGADTAAGASVWCSRRDRGSGAVEPGRSTASPSWPARGRRRPSSSPPWRRCRRRRGDHRRAADAEGQAAGAEELVRSRSSCCLRGGRPLRGRVRHLQHVLDHRRPAHQGDRAAAGDRRQARQVLRSSSSRPLFTGVFASAAGVLAGIGSGEASRRPVGVRDRPAGVRRSSGPRPVPGVRRRGRGDRRLGRPAGAPGLGSRRWRPCATSRWTAPGPVERRSS